MNRHELIDAIMDLAGDEFENIGDVLELAKQSDSELRDTLEHIKLYEH